MDIETEKIIMQLNATAGSCRDEIDRIMALERLKRDTQTLLEEWTGSSIVPLPTYLIKHPENIFDVTTATPQHATPAPDINPRANISQTGELQTTKIGGKEEMPRPLKYGQGSITERKRINKNGSIYKWYEVKWLDEYGKRQTRIAKTKEQGRKILDQFNKRTLKTEKYKYIKTFGVALQEWYDAFRKPNVCARQNQAYQKCINDMPKSIKSKAIDKVTAEELQTHLNNIKTVNPRYWTKLLLVAFLRKAHAVGQVKANIGVLLTAEQVKAHERQVLNREDEPKLLSLLPQQYHQHVTGYIYTGCRLSELLRINPEDVDYDKKIIYIKGTKNKKKRNKDGFDIRVIPLLPEVEPIKFPLQTVSKSWFARKIADACGSLGIKVTTHDFRHTFATRCNEIGINTKALQAIMGHSNYQMTYDRYVKSSKNLLENEFEKLRKSTPISTPIQP